MSLQELKKYFNSELVDLFPKEEVQTLFSILANSYLNLSRVETVLQAEINISPEIINRFEDALAKLKLNEPIQYILGETEFYGLTFLLSRDTLIPRPETEDLVSWVISDQENNNCKYKILDIGTGSGCIAVALAKNLPLASISALDVSKEALKMATKNAINNSVNVGFIEQDILNSEVLPDLFDVIVSNPPYVRELEKNLMTSRVLKYEPPMALFVKDTDPLLFYKKIAKLGRQYLSKKGSLYFEINEYLGIELKEMLENNGYQDVIIRKDIFGKDRMIKCCLNE